MPVELIRRCRAARDVLDESRDVPALRRRHVAQDPHLPRRGIQPLQRIPASTRRGRRLPDAVRERPSALARPPRCQVRSVLAERHQKVAAPSRRRAPRPPRAASDRTRIPARPSIMRRSPSRRAEDLVVQGLVGLHLALDRVFLHDAAARRLAEGAAPRRILREPVDRLRESVGVAGGARGRRSAPAPRCLASPGYPSPRTPARSPSPPAAPPGTPPSALPRGSEARRRRSPIERTERPGCRRRTSRGPRATARRPDAADRRRSSGRLPGRPATTPCREPARRRE